VVADPRVPAPDSGEPVPLPDDDNARRAYASGVSLAREMQQSLAAQTAMGISLPPALVMAGLQDAFNHRPLRMTEEAVRTQLAALSLAVRDRQTERLQEETARGSAFRQAFRQQQGVSQQAGTLYRVADKGHGRRLRQTDMASLLVTARLPDGTVFDDSGEAGREQAVRVGAVLPAIATGLRKVGVGGHVIVVVPPEKGYGDAGLPPVVPGGATLVFDIQVKGLAGAG
jgi:FKBP-type peptidyl-prolyl cis-trans isomerase